MNDNANWTLDVHHDTPALPASHTAADDTAILLPTILPPRATSGDNYAADDLADVHKSVERDEASIYLQILLITAHSIVKALARHCVEIGLPKHYCSN